MRLASQRSVPRCHLVTDTRPGRCPLDVVAAALEAGVGCVQVRAKQHTDRELLALATEVLRLAEPYDALVLVDDRADIALVAGAHGVHVGADDLPVDAARRLLGTDAVIGATARTATAAKAAAAAGADYVGVGPTFATRSKQGLPAPLGIPGVTAVARAVTVPTIAIGGIQAQHVDPLLAEGVHGIAVLSAVSEAADPGAAVGDLLKAMQAL